MRLATFANDHYLQVYSTIDDGKVKVVGYHKSLNLIFCECLSPGVGVLIQDITHPNAIKFIGSYEATGDKKYKWIGHAKLNLNSKWQEPKHTTVATPEEIKYLIEVLEL